MRQESIIFHTDDQIATWTAEPMRLLGRQSLTKY